MSTEPVPSKPVGWPAKPVVTANDAVGPWFGVITIDSRSASAPSGSGAGSGVVPRVDSWPFPSTANREMLSEISLLT